CYTSAMAQSAPPIGQWREHLSYHQSISIELLANKIWAATPFSIFSLDPADNSIERWSRINGLTETGIRTIGTDADATRLVIVYTNGNIDILRSPDVTNVSDILSSQLINDKTINQVYAADGKTWLAGNEAIYVLDAVKGEIKDTYIIGDGGNKTVINSLVLFKGSLFAATAEGIKSAVVAGPNLSDFRNWKTDSSGGLPVAPVNQLAIVGDRIISRTQDSIFISSGTGWTLFYADGWNIHSMQASGGKLILNQVLNNNARVTILNNNGAVERSIQSTLIKRPVETLTFNGNYWIADSLAGLIEVSGNTLNDLNPASPAALTTGPVFSIAGKVAAVSAGLNDNWEPANVPGLITVFENNTWMNYNASAISAIDNLKDIVSVAIDPADKSIWAGSFGGGLINIKEDRSFRIFKQNSFLQEVSSLPGSYRVSGLQFDSENNLWISNYGAEKNLVVSKSDGTSQAFKVPFPLPESAITGIVIDDLNQKWIVSPKGNGIICFNHGQSIANAGDDNWKWYRSGQGNGNLPDNNVLSLARDKDGFIWIGTAHGIGIIRCIQEVFSATGCEAIRPIVQQDNFAGYLFSDEQVQAIAVDGANRKWVGTKNGLWLLSADGEKIIYRFSTANSPLLSDDVRQLTIDPQSGEVFVSTAQGICSFRGTATEGTTEPDNVLIFPNPVPPGYTGTIAIRGVPNNALVKITELNGNLVFQTRALGGQAVWNGKDYKGRQISSGVYLVLVTDEVATKIVYIKK
ncbi:MAG TPA: two-component regulator propeller domain-containing protein, partial [Flavitalea sp.]|nr:two-component regulator propeller domain-containing protein [Flavitalea sp.]